MSRAFLFSFFRTVLTSCAFLTVFPRHSPPSQINSLSVAFCTGTVDLSNYPALAFADNSLNNFLPGFELRIGSKWDPLSGFGLGKLLHDMMPGSFMFAVAYDGTTLTGRAALSDFVFSPACRILSPAFYLTMAMDLKQLMAMSPTDIAMAITTATGYVTAAIPLFATVAGIPAGLLSMLQAMFAVLGPVKIPISMGISGGLMIGIKGQEIRFKTQIEMTTMLSPGLISNPASLDMRFMLQAVQIGMWPDAFFIPRFSIGNMVLKSKFMTQPPYLQVR